MDQLFDEEEEFGIFVFPFHLLNFCTLTYVFAAEHLSLFPKQLTIRSPQMNNLSLVPFVCFIFGVAPCNADIIATLSIP